jgi:tetratricopeptide (TPR) repeat protein
MIMVRRLLVFACVLSAFLVSFICLTQKQALSQEITQDEIYYNEQGLKYFNQGYYKLLPQGRAQEADQLLDQAIAAFKQAIAIKESYADAHRNLARVYYLQKRFTEAAREYERVVELTPDDIDVYVKLATTYTKLEKYPEAIDVLEKAKETTNDEQVVYQLSEYIQRLQHND